MWDSSLEEAFCCLSIGSKDPADVSRLRKLVKAPGESRRDGQLEIYSASTLDGNVG